MGDKEDKVIDVTVKVDPDRLSDFYAMYAEWLAKAPAQAGEDGALADWGPNDREAASYVWSKMHPRARILVEILLDTTQPVSGTDLAKALGPDAREDTVFGSFGPPAKLAKEVGRKHLIRSRPRHSSPGNEYWLDPPVKSMFEQVRAVSSQEDEV
jgi:hypothetical protein